MNRTVCSGPVGAVAFTCALTSSGSTVPGRIQPLKFARIQASGAAADHAWMIASAASAPAAGVVGADRMSWRERP